MRVKSKRQFNVQSIKKKKMNANINSNTNYEREMKLVPINMDYCLLRFDALKFVLDEINYFSIHIINYFYLREKTIFLKTRIIYNSYV